MKNKLSILSTVALLLTSYGIADQDKEDMKKHTVI